MKSALEVKPPGALKEPELLPFTKGAYHEERFSVYLAFPFQIHQKWFGFPKAKI